MILFNQLVGKEGCGLCLQNDTLTISKSMEDYLLLDQHSLTIIIEEGVTARLLDVTQNQRITLLVNKGAQLIYQILNSKNTQRTIDCLGEVHLSEICLEESIEDLRIHLLAEAANATVELLSIASTTSCEFKQRIEHRHKNTNSNISNFGVALHGGSISFDTTGQIAKGMSKSKCVQLSKGILMDDHSCVTSKPILLIDEYDVVANHGASIGKMSDESLFYLMSRGLTKQEAFLLILEGILSPFIEKIKEEDLKTEINQRIEQIMKR